MDDLTFRQEKKKIRVTGTLSLEEHCHASPSSPLKIGIPGRNFALSVKAHNHIV